MKRIILCTAFLAAAMFQAVAQISTSELPYSWTDSKTDFQSRESIQLPAFDVEALRAEDEELDFQKDVPLRFGYVHEGSVDLSEYGTWQTLANGNRLMRIELESEGAYTMNFTFSNFYLPEGAKLWAYSSDETMYRGAFTSENNQADGAFAIGIISGDKVTIELLEPQSVQGQSELVMSHAVHDYRNVYDITRGFDDSGSCNNDVICPEGDGWRDQISSVAMITTQFGSRLCTGALVNNVNEDGTPYFLTANHCLGGETTWVFYFNYDSPTCSPSSDGPLNQSISGSQLRASNGGSDVALLELNSTPPSSYDIFYSGWDRTGNFPTNQVGIHHPSGDVKKISFDNDAASQATFGSTNAACWRIATWEDGTTEPGSSGSPLFDQNQRIIGQLYGGTASCSNNIDDYYGRFDVSWDGPSASSRLRDWLDPSNSVTVLDGFDPNTPSVSVDAGVQSVNSPTGIICADGFTPQIVLRNFGANTLTAVDVVYDLDGGTVQTFNWTGSLLSGETETLTLSDFTGIAAGSHVFNVSTQNPNGQTDQNTANDQASSSFDLSGSGAVLNLDLLTDNYPGETTWELTDDQSNVLYSGGPYSGQQTLYNEQLCVGGGCYTFTVYDSFGDGLQYNGVVGDYTLSVEGGTILAEMVSGGDFGNEAIDSFCLTSGCTDPIATNYDSDANVDDGSCFYDPVQADFSANPLSVTAGQSVSFTNLSSGAISAYNWSFPGGTPSSSSAENPVVVFNNEGIIDITLQVTGPTGSDTEVKLAYINVLPPTQNCVAAFPFIDNFDNLAAGSSNLNTDWEQGTNDDFDWLVNAGTTASNNTGPGSDHTTGNGNYLYTEASDPNFPAKSAILLSPCLDISSISSDDPHASFYYHMYGASMGQLHVDLFANGSWSDDFFVVSGDQGNQWLQANLSLDGYTGVIQLRFRGITGTGNQGWQSDIAIDDFMVYEFVAIPGCTDPAANNYDPQANEDDGSCEYGCLTNEDLLQIVIQEDNYPGETSWELVDETNTLIASGTTDDLDICVEQNNCYTFTIFDTYGDGICCGYGNGSYTLSLNGNQIAAGGDFDFEESVQFNCAPGSTCSEGIAVSEGLFTAGQPDTWYIYTPQVNGQYSISTCSQGNTCDTKIFLYDYCAGLNWDDTNAGTIAYNDDFCGIQSEITPFLEGGVTYYLRIGDDGTSCSNSSINFEISYVGGIAGCMDPLACNYSPLASETGPCYYNNDPNCSDLGPDLDVLENVFYNSMYLTTISATQNNNYTCLIDEGCVGGYGTRDIVRFTTHIKNIGNQDYYIGSPSSQNGQFEWDPCHGHWHYEGYAEYVLYDDAGVEMPYIGFKNGFCVLDLECSDGGTAKFTCGNMGITAGCGDYYSSSLSCQWLDLTDVPAGDYTMVVKVNWDQSPDALGRYELAYDNNWAHVCISFDRDANGDIINFSKSQGDCIIIEDCVGQPFGNAQPDCEGNCPGSVVTGDIDDSGEMDVLDVMGYLTGILGDDISVSPCTDINMSGDITVADAAILSDCSIYGEEEITVGGVHNHCIFGPEVINPDHTTTLSIGDANFDEGYIDIYVQNPDNEILGYQFSISGIDISGVENLIDPQQYPVTPQFLFGSNEIIALSLEDSTINKYVNPTPLLRIHYLSLTAQEVCIEQIVDVVNEHTESVLTIAGPCFETNFDEPIADFSFDANEFCEGGTVNFTDLSSNQPTSWLWSFPGGTPSSSTLQNPTVTYNAPGVHNVSLTATNQYGSDVQLAINGIVVHDDPALSTTATSVSCNGDATGTIDLAVSGGQSPYTYDWSNGYDQEDPVGLIAGQYSVTVTDFNGCTANISAIVSQPTALNLTEVSNSPSSCGSADGVAIVTASGGASNYTYAWQPGNLSGAAQTQLTPGNYTVTVTDGNLCSTSIEIVIGSSGVLDCFGVCGGTAYLDNCNDCVGGDTGADPCVADCNGDFGGTAYLDNCNDCVGGETGADPCVADCNGDFGGTAYLDNCNDCVGGDTGADPCVADCNGDFGGTAYLDNCNDCVGGETGADPCVADCNGDFGGTAYLDNCNDCVGGDTGADPCVADCNGDFGGTAYLDNCNDCVGGNTGADPCVADCNGDFGGTAYLDNCNDCVGGNTGADPCVADCNGDFGGTAYLDNCNDCVGGNTGADPCVADCNGDFGGTAYLDNCNDCVGGETGADPCVADCNGDFGGTAYLDNCNDCVGGETGADPCVADCNGDFGGTAYLDNCNNCVGGDTGADPCVADCNGDFGGTAYLDNCNDCVGGNTGADPCVADCNGDFGGTAYLDNCNDCVGGNTGADPCVADCNGDFGGTAYLDNCNDCVGGNTGADPCVADCNGDFGGTAYLDNCNDCVGGETGADPCVADCNGDFGGTAYLDNCNDCVGGETGADPCVADCNGDFGGTAYLDNCNNCVGGDTGADPCVADCNGDFGGTAYLDNCNDCVGGETGADPCVADCNGDFGGTAYLDNCNDCVGGNTGADPCVADCNGDFGGTAYLDDCGDCVGGNTGADPCVICDPGYFVDNGSCTICPPGTYCPGDGNSYPCEAGEFSSVSGAISCLPCTAGYYNPTTGSTSCLPCEAGSFSDVIGATECMDCPAGTSQGFVGQTSCVDCVAGTYSDVTGAIECTDCPAGTSSEEGATTCDPCSFDLTSSSQPATTGFANGSASVVASGGNPPYNYIWDDSFMQTDATAVGLFAGSYTCVVTDSDGCEATIEVVVSMFNDIPETEMLDTYCNTSGYELSEFIACNPVQDADAYRWEFTVQGGAALPEYTRTGGNQWVRLQWISGIDVATTYDVRVKARVNGVWGEYGAVCTITTVSLVPLTEVRPQYHPTNSLGQAYNLCDFIMAYNVTNASNYRWRFDPDENPENGNEIIYTRGAGNSATRLSWVDGLTPATTYEVAVQAAIGSTWGSYGAVHSVNLAQPPAPVVRASFCNQTYAPNGYVLSTSVCDASYYQFEFEPVGGGPVSTLNSGNYVAFFNNLSPSLSPGDYNVRVRVSQGGVLGNFGASCLITVNGPQNLAQESLVQKSFEINETFSVFPNPNDGNDLWLEMKTNSAKPQKVDVACFDVYGKQIFVDSFQMEGRSEARQLDTHEGLANGLYMLKIVVNGEQVALEKLVVQ